MYKSIDRYLIGYNKDTDVVTVAAQVFLVRTDNPDETVVAYDAKQLKYIADFDFFKVNLSPFVEELNRQELPLSDRLVAQIKNKMKASWYEDFAKLNGLYPLDEIKKMIEASKQKEVRNAER